MTEPDPRALDELFTRVLHTEDDALRAARESAAAADMPAIEVSAQHGRLLSLLARMSNAKRVLEDEDPLPVPILKSMMGPIDKLRSIFRK